MKQCGVYAWFPCDVYCQNKKTAHVNIDIFKRKNICKSLNIPIFLVIIQTIFRKVK